MRRGEATRLFPAVNFDALRLGPDLRRAWLEAILWAAGCLNRTPTKANIGWRTAHEVYCGKKPPLQVIPFMQSGRMRVNRSAKIDRQSVEVYYLNSGYNHSSSTVKVLRASTGAINMTKNVVWTVPRFRVLPLPPPDGEGGSGATPAAAATLPPGYTVHYVPPTPVTSTFPDASNKPATRSTPPDLGTPPAAYSPAAPASASSRGTSCTVSAPPTPSAGSAQPKPSAPSTSQPAPSVTSTPIMPTTPRWQRFRRYVIRKFIDSLQRHA